MGAPCDDPDDPVAPEHEPLQSANENGSGPCPDERAPRRYLQRWEDDGGTWGRAAPAACRRLEGRV
jgi:hypothetical protein